MARYCPIVKEMVVYMVCSECDNKVCKKMTNEELINSKKENKDKEVNDEKAECGKTLC